jgi:hypothetical protein
VKVLLEIVVELVRHFRELGSTTIDWSELTRLVGRGPRGDVASMPASEPGLLPRGTTP